VIVLLTLPLISILFSLSLLVCENAILVLGGLGVNLVDIDYVPDLLLQAHF
jgi:hypothetical protein